MGTRAPSGSSLLSALSQNGVLLPSACGGRGTCSMCKCRVLEGGRDVQDRREEVLVAAEGLVLDLGLLELVDSREDLAQRLWIGGPEALSPGPVGNPLEQSRVAGDEGVGVTEARQPRLYFALILGLGLVQEILQLVSFKKRPFGGNEPRGWLL